MPNEFTLVGENRDDASELLVVGADGQYYEYDVARERFSPVEPDEHWELFASPDQPDQVEEPAS